MRCAALDFDTCADQQDAELIAMTLALMTRTPTRPPARTLGVPARRHVLLLAEVDAHQSTADFRARYVRFARNLYAGTRTLSPAAERIVDAIASQATAVAGSPAWFVEILDSLVYCSPRQSDHSYDKLTRRQF